VDKRILIIGGTRNMGYMLSQQLAQAGSDLTLLNRGLSPDDLPRSIHRLHVDRRDTRQMRRALLARPFDIIIDFVLYDGDAAHTIVDLTQSTVRHYIAISSGQVYLVREGLARPFTESDYDGPVMPVPPETSYDFEEWRYGTQKRDAEDLLLGAWERSGFPATVLRLPMVNSARDPYQRLYNYVLRLRDGGGLLVPDLPDYTLNQVYALDVVRIIRGLIDSGDGKGKAYNISQDEHISHADFVNMLAAIMGLPARVQVVPRQRLVEHGFLPDCAPFAEKWMSALDNSLSKRELGAAYTPLDECLTQLLRNFGEHTPPLPRSYSRRHAEQRFAATVASANDK